MTDLGMGALAGLVLGGFYFGGLWMTVRRIPQANRPGMLVAGSYFVRLAVLGAGLVAVVRMGGGGALIAALVGLLLVRYLMTRGPAWS